MKVLHINYSDRGGGAEEFAYSLAHSQHNSVLYVGIKYSGSSRVKEIPKLKVAWLFSFLDKVCWKVGFKCSFRAMLGIQDMWHFTFRTLRNLADFESADIIHLHNIHGEFFDLNAIPKIARIKPILWTLHDMWSMTGGEGFVFEGMSKKQRLTAYPMRNPILDTRPYFQKLKKKLVRENRNSIFLSVPSYHYQNVAREYFGIDHIDLIYGGVDTSIFYYLERKPATIPSVLIFNSNSMYKNSKRVIKSLLETKSTFRLHVLGHELQEWDKRIEVRNHGFIQSRKEIADLFKAVDIAIFWSNEETFGLLPSELAATGAVVFLNDSLPVFHEHVQLYAAVLYENEKDLAIKVDSAVNGIVETRVKGKLSSEAVKKNLDRAITIEKYQQSYSKLKSQWNPA